MATDSTNCGVVHYSADAHPLKLLFRAEPTRPSRTTTNIRVCPQARRALRRVLLHWKTFDRDGNYVFSGENHGSSTVVDVHQARVALCASRRAHNHLWKGFNMKKFTELEKEYDTR